MALLSTFDEQHPRQSLSDIARRADMPMPTAHRILKELEVWQAVEREADGTYRVGSHLWQLGTLAVFQKDLRETALPPMQDLMLATQENVTLAVLSGDTALYVERLRSKGSVPVESRAGRHLPLHATGVGKVLLAWSGDDRLIQRCAQNLVAVTPHTITDPTLFLRELDWVRRNGFARSLEEMTPGTLAVAVPLLGQDDRAFAALGLISRSVRRDLVKFVPAMRVVAATISRAYQYQAIPR